MCVTEHHGDDCTASLQTFRVGWAGAQDDLLAGDLRSQADLRPLAGLAHLWGLGPAAGLRGEITVFDGRPDVAVVQDDGRLVISHRWPQAAPFFVHASVSAWEAQPLPALPDLQALEDHLAQVAPAVGLDLRRPFPFRVLGQANELSYHVQNKTDTRPHDAAEHRRTMVHTALQETVVELLGFHAPAHRGVFIPAGATIHVHLRTADGRHGGHVDRCALAGGATLLLPAR
jgi:acetolactate decarboxylase